MWENNRPSGWKWLLHKKLFELVESKGAERIFDDEYAEVGADAMLEGLKREGIGYVDGCSAEALEALRSYISKLNLEKGYLVYIPD